VQHPQSGVSRKALASVGIVSVLLTLLFINSLADNQVQDSLQVFYIDVGQGDSILLHASDDTDVLIDGGPRSAGPAVVAHLRNQRIDDIDVMVLTHGDADHVGGLISVLRSSIPVEAVVYNGQQYAGLTYREFITETQRRGLTPTPAQAGQIYAWGPITTSVLNPQTQGSLGLSQDDNSVVMLVAYGDMRFLFTGDISSDVEQGILDAGTLRTWTEADVLKVAHHGSAYGSSAPFLEAVGAEAAVISVGADNVCKSPAQETLDRLETAGAKVLRTDRYGTIVVTTDGQTYSTNVDYVVLFPLAAKMPTSTPTPTSTPLVWPGGTPTPTPTTPIPSATPTGTPRMGHIVITDIFSDGAGSSDPDEYVEIYNDGGWSVQLGGWTLRDEDNHVFTFPDLTMWPGRVCRIYTNEYHAEWCGLNYGSKSAIWGDCEDCAYLRGDWWSPQDIYCYE
jgi:competence protein ComEC